MMRLAEYRSKSALLADFLPWAALVADGVVLALLHKSVEGIHVVNPA
jgi:type IV secretory pathway VirB4 component